MVSRTSLPVDHATVHHLVDALPRIALSSDAPTPVEELSRLRDLLGMRARLLVKRDDALSFGAGGNKVRKLEMLAARAVAEGADTLVTTGGVQSNHARVTAAAAARLGLRCVLVVNGEQPARPTGNALLVQLLGADVEYVASREDRAPHMQRVVDRLRDEHRRPFAIPLGASTPLGSLGYVRALAELLTQIPAPDLIVHASSSGGTQAGLVAACALFGLKTRVLGFSVDDRAADIIAGVSGIIGGLAPYLNLDPEVLARQPIEVDDGFVDGGYGVVGPRTREAMTLAARTEALLMDPVYGAKAMAGLIAHARDGRLDAHDTVLFWHTGGQPGIFA